MNESKGLRFKGSRKAVLGDLANQVESIWAGFDAARDSEPELNKASKLSLIHI